MPKESVLTQEEKESIKIERFIFHIIVESDIKPIFLEDVDLDATQKIFFKKIFVDASDGTQFMFNDKSTSAVFKNCKTIIDDEASFVKISEILTASFQSDHNKTTKDGVFITALISIKGNVKLIFLLKLDNRKVYEYLKNGNKGLLKEIKNTFVEDKRAIQKKAIIDVSDYFAWDVLASDRNPSPGKVIRDYFQGFLDVYEKETPTTLTRNSISYIREWANINISELDPNQDTSFYKKRGLDYLSQTSKFKSTEFINAVIFDDDDIRKRNLKSSFKKYLVAKGLFGQEFKPSKSVLTSAKTKNVAITAEDVKIEWEGDSKNSNIVFQDKVRDSQGFFSITIKSSKIIYKQ